MANEATLMRRAGRFVAARKVMPLAVVVTVLSVAANLTATKSGRAELATWIYYGMTWATILLLVWAYPFYKVLALTGIVNACRASGTNPFKAKEDGARWYLQQTAEQARTYSAFALLGALTMAIPSLIVRLTGNMLGDSPVLIGIGGLIAAGYCAYVAHESSSIIEEIWRQEEYRLYDEQAFAATARGGAGAAIQQPHGYGGEERGI